MADEVDLANQIQDEHLARGIAAARRPIPAGAPGECEQCGEDMPRLVDGLCAPCRDGRRRPPAVFRAVAPSHDTVNNELTIQAANSRSKGAK